MAKKKTKIENELIDKLNENTSSSKENLPVENAPKATKKTSKKSSVIAQPQDQPIETKMSKEAKKEAELIKKAIIKSPAPKIKENVVFTTSLEEPQEKKTSKKTKSTDTKAKETKLEKVIAAETPVEEKKSKKSKASKIVETEEKTSDKSQKTTKKKTTEAPVAEEKSKATIKKEEINVATAPKTKKTSKKATVAEEQPKQEVLDKPKSTTKKQSAVDETAALVETTTAEPAPNKEDKPLENQELKAPEKPKVRYSDEDLEMFKNVILEAKREAAEELRMLKERLDDLNSYDLAEESMIYSMHMGEQGSEPMEKEKTYAQIQRINEYIKKLDDALERIKDKTYGICRVCGILIAKERLLAVPITTLSASWKIHNRCPEDGIDRIIAVK